MPELNPYAPPGDAADARPAVARSREPGLYRDGRHLVVTLKSPSLPGRCVLCNDPEVGERIRQDFSWHPMWVYLTLLGSIIAYWLAAAATRRTVTLEFGLCAPHRKQRDNGLLLAWVGGLIGIALVVLGIVSGMPPLTTFGVLTTVALIVAGNRKARTVYPDRIDAHHAWLVVGALFLQSIGEREA